jgi:hypothetical protein
VEECETCKSGKKSNQYLRKNGVYEITCSHCGILYIGETGRTIGSRIKEHLTMEKQTVYKHLESHKETGHAPNHNDITLKILHSNIKFADERICIEAFEMQKKSHNIMNACIGRTITI